MTTNCKRRTLPILSPINAQAITPSLAAGTTNACPHCSTNGGLAISYTELPPHSKHQQQKDKKVIPKDLFRPRYAMSLSLSQTLHPLSEKLMPFQSHRSAKDLPRSGHSASAWSFTVDCTQHLTDLQEPNTS